LRKLPGDAGFTLSAWSDTTEFARTWFVALAGKIRKEGFPAPCKAAFVAWRPSVTNAWSAGILFRSRSRALNGHMKPITIRRLVPSDASRHRALMLEAYASAPDAFTSSVTEREKLPLEWWAARMSDMPEAPELVCGAFAADELVGAAGLQFEQRERTRHKATLFGMVVGPAARGQGLGKRLIEEILREARQSPLTTVVQLTVTESNAAAVGLYRNCGFVPFGVEPFAVKLGEHFITKLHMWYRVERGT